MRVIIVGGGIIGAALARDLCARGARVTLIEARGISSGATGASFGWVNAAFHLDDAHFRLRRFGIEAWHRLDLDRHLRWTGCLSWEETGDAFDRQRDDLLAKGYAVEELDASAFATREPHVTPPDRALFFAVEGVAEPRAVTEDLLARADGVQVIEGVPVTAISHKAGHVTGVNTPLGPFEADRVIVTAGNGAPALLEPLGVSLPMRHRPGVILRTRALPPLVSHVLASPAGEVRQDLKGHIWMPAAIGHQADQGEEIEARPDTLAGRALARLRDILPGVELSWDRVHVAARPVPGDDRPAIGPAGPEGLFLAVMHSGVTLAAVTAECLGAMVAGAPLTNSERDMVAPYDPARFQSGSS